MIEDGWIKLHRKFLNWGWHDTPEMVSLFIHLLLEANHEDMKWHGLTISRGQLITSRDKLSELTGLSIRKVRTCMDRLEETGEIIKEPTNKYTLVTICNYGIYQVKEESQRPTTGQQTTSERPAIDQQSTTNKNDKNIRIDISTLSMEQAAPEDFHEDWRIPLSSVRKSFFNFDKNRIAEYKRELFAQELEPVALKIGMPQQSKESFIRWWTAHDPGQDRIKAEDARPFDMEARALSWMEKEKPKSSKQTASQKRSKMEETIESRNEFQLWVHEQFGTTGTGFGSSPAESGAPDYQSGE